jgi:hypothetical protein
MQTRTEIQTRPRLNESDDFAGLVQRAAVQIGSLRRTLEEAAECDRLVRERAAELARRLEQGERFNQEMDGRLAAASGAVGILEKTAAGLHALEGLIARVQAAKQEWEQAWARRLDEERAVFESRLNQHVREVDERQEAHAKRVDHVIASLDRKAAAIQARCALALDQSEERIAQLERRAADLAGPTLDEFQSLFERAQALIGAGPNGAQPREGTLHAAVAGAQQTVTDCNDAAVRLGALIEHSRPAREAIEAVTTAAAERAALLDRCMNQATDQAQALVTIVKDVMPLIERAEAKRSLRAAA